MLCTKWKQQPSEWRAVSRVRGHKPSRCPASQDAATSPWPLLGTASLLLSEMAALEENKAHPVLTKRERSLLPAGVSTALRNGVLDPLPRQTEVWIHFLRSSIPQWAAMTRSWPHAACVPPVICTCGGTQHGHVAERRK